MRITLDTNVLIAAFVARGVCHKLLEHCVRRYTLVTSEFILDEVQEKLVNKFKYSLELADEVVTLLRSQMTVVTPINLAVPVCRDADDDFVLATAMTGNCKCIITGDKDLHVLKQFNGINIFNPSDFQIYETTSEP